MSKSQRTKGASGEREVVHIIRDELGIECHRNLDQVRDGGADIFLKPYRIEVKRRARIANIYEWVAQAEKSCAIGERPVVAFRADGKGWLAVVPLTLFLSLIREEIVE